MWIQVCDGNVVDIRALKNVIVVKLSKISDNKMTASELVVYGNWSTSEKYMVGLIR